MVALSSELRGILEKAVLAGRAASEAAADAALNTLGLTTSQPYATLTDEQRRHRVALRARARQLGEGSVESGRHLLVEEIAYDQWHRMLFARFLAENDLLMHPSGVAVTLEECAELAAEEGEPDAWSLAARYASAMLPGIFRRSDPASQVRFAPEGRKALESVIVGLPAATFTADDSLGRTYQFWQAKKNTEVLASERKIGGEDLYAVTQFFTEDYMVRFLLENSLGAWWAARHPDSPLIHQYEYLRFHEDGAPAAGTFPGWPDRAVDVTVMDPCCGSGHFLVTAFEMLRRMRMEEEEISEREAADAVLRDNLFGLEIDPRCVQIAAFALAFAAWKAAGYRRLPPLNLACSGIPVQGQLDVWTDLARDDARLRLALESVHRLFREAPTLGSLINPASSQDSLFAPEYSNLEPVLERALSEESAQQDPVAEVFGAATEGIVRAAHLLATEYTLVATNVPYLTRGKQDVVLRDFIEREYPDAKADLATTFLERCLTFTKPGGSVSVVSPQNWLFLGTYKALRSRLLVTAEWDVIARLGPSAFYGMNWWAANTALLILERAIPSSGHFITNLDVSAPRVPDVKAQSLRFVPLISVSQVAQLDNADARIAATESLRGPTLERYAWAYSGIRSGDAARFGRCFWELPQIEDGWERWQSTYSIAGPISGCEHILLWENGTGQLATYQRELAQLRYASGAWKQGEPAWGKCGVLVSQMGRLPVSLYLGDLFDNNAAAIIPHCQEHLPAIWTFCSSPEFYGAVRSIDQKTNVTNATLVKVPFDLSHWQMVAEISGPLPEAKSSHPTQWLFLGDPVGSVNPLQVAAARLLGYQWPGQTPDHLDVLSDTDGIVCVPAALGKPPASQRLRSLLVEAYHQDWSGDREVELLASVDFPGKSLHGWLLDGFFAQHCRLFHNRPFIWHVWDGRRDGFSALVNYHKLDAANLDRLIYSYLGSWIERQRADRDAGVPGAEGRLVAALELQDRLRLIREGEKPYDIYVRWKAMEEQPIGWNPDLNDGVRLNIRPFVLAGVLRNRFTIHWNKDKGKNPDGSERLNDLHLAIAEKRAAREAAGV